MPSPKASSLSRAFLANRAQRRGIYSFEVRRGSDDDGRVFKQHSINLSLMAFVGPSWPYHGFWWSWSKWWWFQLKLKSHPGHRVVTSHANLRNWWCTKWRFPLFGTEKSFPNSIQNLDLQRNGRNLSVREIWFFYFFVKKLDICFHEKHSHQIKNPFLISLFSLLI